MHAICGRQWRRARLLYHGESSADGGGGGDGFVTVGEKLPARLDLIEQGFNGGGGRPGCAHARNIGGNLVVVHQSVGYPEVLKKFLGYHGVISNIFII